MALTNYERNQIKKRIEKLFPCNVRVIFGETDKCGTFEYTAHFNNDDELYK